MRPVFIQALSVLGVVLGCYLFLGLGFPQLRHWSWRKDPAGVVASCPIFSILLALCGLGVARPYTWIAALAALGTGCLILARKPAELALLFGPLLQHRRAFIAFFLVSIVAVLVCALLA